MWCVCVCLVMCTYLHAKYLCVYCVHIQPPQSVPKSNESSILEKKSHGLLFASQTDTLLSEPIGGGGGALFAVLLA